MPRRSKYVEFINVLFDVLDVRDKREFSKRIGKQYTNVCSYIKGEKIPGKSVILSSLRNAFEWDVRAIVEIRPIEESMNLLSNVPGIYCIYDSSASVIYVGQATNLRVEINQTLQRSTNFPVRRGPRLREKNHPNYREIAKYISAYEVKSPNVRHNLEAILLRCFPNQSHNNKMGNFR